MKKRSKQIFGFLGILATLGILTSCNSFCSVGDNAAYRYAYDPVNTIFFESEDDAADYLLNSLSKENQTVYFKSNNEVVSLESLRNYNLKIFNENGEVVTTKLIDNASIFTNEYTSSLSSSSNADFSQIYFIRTTTIETYTLNENEEKTEYTFKVSKNSYVESVETSSNSSGFNRPADQYWTDLDSKVISYISSKMLPVFNPPPYPNKIILSPLFNCCSFCISYNAIGILAQNVFPLVCILVYILFISKCNLDAIAFIIFRFD